MIASPLFRARFSPPATRPPLISRPQLLRRLDQGLQGKLTLISAPAGYGKTTLLAEWCTVSPAPVAWISLEAGDNDPAQFNQCLRAALENTAQAAGRIAAEDPGDLPLEAALQRLLADLDAAAQPLALVFDDYHLIKNPGLHQALAAMLDNLPAHLHLYLATRKDPPIPLARLRSLGQLVEVRARHLRFSAAESADFLEQKMGLRLSSEDLAALSRRTEGWAAGLQLAALSLLEQPDPHPLIQTISGSSRFILDYLVEEVLDRQPDEIQSFLLRTSLLRRLSAPLCAELTGSPIPDSARTLAYLERSNLFLTPLDAQGEWYRYHQLFAELLQRRLRETAGPEEAADLHRRAAGWYRQAGDLVEAIHHALAGKDWPEAADLMEQASTDFFKTGALGTYLPLLRLLPETELHRRPQLLQDMGWGLALTNDLEQAERYLILAEAAQSEQPNFLGETLAGQAYAACFQFDIQRALTLGRRALELLHPENEFMRSVAAMVLGFACWFTGDPQETERAMQTALHAARRSGGQRVQKLAQTYLGRSKALQMDFLAAEELALAAIGNDAQPRLNPGNDVPAFDLGALYYEWNDLEAAERYLELGFAANEANGNLLSRASGLRSLARLRQAQGRAAEAWAAAQQAARLSTEIGLAPSFQNLDAACCVEISLAQGDLERAGEWANRTSGPDGLEAYQPLPALAQARLWIARGRPETARRMLAELEPRVAEPAWRFARFRLRLLQAMADPGRARALLAPELPAAMKQKLARSLIDLGEPMGEILRGLAFDPTLEGRLAGLISCFPGTERVKAVTAAEPSREELSPPVEPLSERELEVLRAMAAGEGTAEIACGLFVAQSTVRSHIKNIFAKLNVHSRLQAVEHARRRGLI